MPLRGYYGAANARDAHCSESRVTSFGFTLNHRFNDRLSIRNALRRYDYSLDRNNTVVGSVNEAALRASLNRSNVRRDEDGYFNQTELTRKLDLAGMRRQILYGVEFGKQNKDQLFQTRNNIATVALFNPRPPALPFNVSAAPSTDNLGIMKTASIYLQDLVAISDHWKALAGVRYDRFEQETDERRPGQRDLSRTDRAWSPRVGLVYQPALAQSCYASVSKSFQPSGESFPLAPSNADIAPERTTNREIGAKFGLFDGRASESPDMRCAFSTHR